MRIDEIAFQYVKENGMKHIHFGMLEDMQMIYWEWYLQFNDKPPNILPAEQIRRVSRALAKSNLFYVKGKIPSHWGRLNMYIAKK